MIKIRWWEKITCIQNIFRRYCGSIVSAGIRCVTKSVAFVDWKSGIYKNPKNCRVNSSMLQRKHVATATDARIQEQTFHRRQVPLRLGSQAVIR